MSLAFEMMVTSRLDTEKIMARQQKREPTAISPTVEPVRSLFDRVAGFLDANEWRYDAVQEKNYFDMRCRIKDASVRVVVDVYEAEDWRRILVYSVYPVYVPENRRADVLDAINRINYALIYGNLEMDKTDGEIRVRTAVESTGDIPDAMMDRALNSNLNTASRYFAPILAVTFGNAAADTILDLAASPEEKTVQ